MSHILEVLEAEYIEEASKAGLSKEERQQKVACRDVFQIFKNNLELNGTDKGSLAVGMKAYIAAIVEVTGLAIAMTGEADGFLLKLTLDGIKAYADAMKPRMDAAREAVMFLREIQRAAEQSATKGESNGN